MARVAGGGDAFGGGGEAGHRGQSGARDPVTERGSQQHTGRAHRRQQQGGLPDAPLHRVGAQGQLKGSAAADRRDRETGRVALVGEVREVRGALPRCHLADRWRDRQDVPLPGVLRRVRRHDLGARGRGQVAALARQHPGRRMAVRLHEAGRRLRQVQVELVVHLVPDDEVRGRADPDRDQGDRGGRGEGEAGAQRAVAAPAGPEGATATSAAHARSRR